MRGPPSPSSTSSSISASGSARANGCAASRPAPRSATPPGRSAPGFEPLAGRLARAARRRPVRGSARARHRAARLRRRHRPPDGADRRGRAAGRKRPSGRSSTFAPRSAAATASPGVLERAGVGSAEADQVAALIGGAVPLDDIRPGTVDGPDARPPPEPQRRPPARPARLPRPLRPHASRSRRAGGALALTRIPIAVDETPLRIQGRVGASLYRSARAAGVPARAVEAYIRALNTPDQRAGRARLRRPLRHHHRASPRRHRRGRDRAACSMPASTAPSGRDLQLMQWDQRRPDPMVRGLGRRPRRAAA